MLKLAVLGFFALVTGQSQASSITDGYTGSNDHGYGDVIGDSSTFNISGATITRVGNVLTIVISTNFAGQAGVDSTIVNGGIGYGDVFLSSTWNAAGTATSKYATDSSTTGTVWDYGLSLNNALSNKGGTFSLYQLNGATNADNILDSQDVMNCKVACTYRDGQEDKVDTTSSTVKDTGIDGTWTVNDAANTISFVLDLSGSDMMNWSSFAMHWGETCQNDVIEGVAYGVHIPVPGSAALLVLGLGALGFARRRRRM
jgi:hypothetical protein